MAIGQSVISSLSCGQPAMGAMLTGCDKGGGSQVARPARRDSANAHKIH